MMNHLNVIVLKDIEEHFCQIS